MNVFCFTPKTPQKKLLCFLKTLTAAGLALILYSGCSAPICLPQYKSITVTLPDWPDMLPEFQEWKICVWQDKEYSCKTISSGQVQTTIVLDTNRPAAVLASPLFLDQTLTDYFLPAGSIFCPESDSDQSLPLDWPQGMTAACLRDLFTDSDCNPQIIRYFNWQKLQAAVAKKDSEAFSKFDSLKTPKCTAAGDFKWEDLKDKIKNLKSVTVSGFSSVTVEVNKISGMENADLRYVYYPYVPMNEFMLSKNKITVRNEPADCVTKLLYNGRIISIQKKKLLEPLQAP